MVDGARRVASGLRHVELLHRTEGSRQRILGPLVDDGFAIDPRVQVGRQRHVAKPAEAVADVLDVLGDAEDLLTTTMPEPEPDSGRLR